MISSHDAQTNYRGVGIIQAILHEEAKKTLIKATFGV